MIKYYLKYWRYTCFWKHYNINYLLFKAQLFLRDFIHYYIKLSSGYLWYGHCGNFSVYIKKRFHSATEKDFNNISHLVSNTNLFPVEKRFRYEGLRVFINRDTKTGSTVILGIPQDDEFVFS